MVNAIVFLDVLYRQNPQNHLYFDGKTGFVKIHQKKTKKSTTTQPPSKGKRVGVLKVLEEKKNGSY